MKKEKLYKVKIGKIENGEEYPFFDSYNVVAKDATEAMRRVRLKKDEYYESIELICSIDKP